MDAPFSPLSLAAPADDVVTREFVLKGQRFKLAARPVSAYINLLIEAEKQAILKAHPKGMVLWDRLYPLSETVVNALAVARAQTAFGDPRGAQWSAIEWMTVFIQDEALFAEIIDWLPGRPEADSEKGDPKAPDSETTS